MAFQKAVPLTIWKTKNSDGEVDGIQLVFRIHDNAFSEILDIPYLVTGEEFESLPTGVAAKKAALVAIVKREARDRYAEWKQQILERPKASIIGDPFTDLGLVEITDFSGAAPPKGSELV